MADNRQQVKGDILYYKNRPLVREKDTICYGDFTEKCVLIFEIMSYVEENGTKVPGKIFIQVLESEIKCFDAPPEKPASPPAHNTQWSPHLRRSASPPALSCRILT